MKVPVKVVFYASNGDNKTDNHHGIHTSSTNATNGTKVDPYNVLTNTSVNFQWEWLRITWEGRKSPFSNFLKILKTERVKHQNKPFPGGKLPFISIQRFYAQYIAMGSTQSFTIGNIFVTVIHLQLLNTISQKPLILFTNKGSDKILELFLCVVPCFCQTGVWSVQLKKWISKSRRG